MTDSDGGCTWLLTKLTGEHQSATESLGTERSTRPPETPFLATASMPWKSPGGGMLTGVFEPQPPGPVVGHGIGFVAAVEEEQPVMTTHVMNTAAIFDWILRGIRPVNHPHIGRCVTSGPTPPSRR